MNKFWLNKKVLVTGGSGFIGRHLITKLDAEGAKITALQPKLPRKQQGVINFVKGDVGDELQLKKLFSRYGFQFCFHLAAQSLVDPASSDPLPTFETNIRGTWNILEQARKYKVEGMIIASTSHVYGKNKLPFLEEYFPKPSGPYETSKACADMLAQTYASYYSLPVAIARFANIYGPGDQNYRIVPKTINLLLKNKKPELYADKTTRDYMYIEDAIDAYLTLAKKIKQLHRTDENIIFNFGTGTHHSNAEIIARLIKLLKKDKIRPLIVSKGRKQEISKQYLSIKKAKKILGWSPQHSLNDGLTKTINWHLAQQK